MNTIKQQIKMKKLLDSILNKEEKTNKSKPIININNIEKKNKDTKTKINANYMKLLCLFIKKYDNNKFGRKNKCSIEEYLNVIFYVLITGIQWHSLNEKLSYSSYWRKYDKWCKYNIFSTVYHTFLKIMMSTHKISLKNLYIDSTMIKNIRGCDFYLKIILIDTEKVTK